MWQPRPSRHAEQQAVLASAEATADRIRAEVAIPLIELATTDGTAYLAAWDRVWAASDAHRTVRGLRKRDDCPAALGQPAADPRGYRAVGYHSRAA